MILRVINNVIRVEHPACQGMTNDTGEMLSVRGFETCINFVYSVFTRSERKTLALNPVSYACRT